VAGRIKGRCRSLVGGGAARRLGAKRRIAGITILSNPTRADFADYSYYGPRHAVH